MIVLTEQSISALSALSKTGKQKRKEFVLDLNEPHLLNLPALCHAIFSVSRVYRRNSRMTGNTEV